MTRLRSLLAGVVTMLLLSAASTVAWACPVCAQNTRGDTGFLFLIGGLMLLPFPITAVIFYFVRRAQRDLAREDQHDLTHP